MPPPLSLTDASPLPSFGTPRRIVGAGVALYLVYAIAAVFDPSGAFTNVAFAVVMLPMPFVAWLAYTRAPPPLRRFWFLLATAAWLWFLGTVVWYAAFFAAGSEAPDSPGVWDAVFAAARLTLIVAIVLEMRSLIRFGLAALDASVIGAAGIAIGAAMVGRSLERGWTPRRSSSSTARCSAR